MILLLIKGLFYYNDKMLEQAMIATEQRYKKVTLTLTWACEWFAGYLVGLQFHVGFVSFVEQYLIPYEYTSISLVVIEAITWLL